MCILGQIAGYTIKLVDGEEVRKTNPDFILYAHRNTQPGIPEHEIWLDGSADPKELTLYLVRALFERMLYDRGLRDEAITSASNALERSIRQASPPRDVKTRLLTQYGMMNIWLVQGDEVRKQFDTAFVHGGNGFRYSFIPKYEIWIDEQLSPQDRAFTLIHELYESSLMREGREYGPAHDESSYIEKKLRNLVSS